MRVKTIVRVAMVSIAPVAIRRKGTRAVSVERFMKIAPTRPCARATTPKTMPAMGSIPNAVSATSWVAMKMIKA